MYQRDVRGVHGDVLVLDWIVGAQVYASNLV
jgi:hypothetical protein